MSYFRNVMVLISGTSVSQVVVVASSPVLARLYTPEDFAVFAIFAAFVQIIGVLATGRYELAIILPEKHVDAYEVGIVAVLISFLVSVTTLLVMSFFGNQIALFLSLPRLSTWLLLVPCAVFLTTLFLVMQSFSVRLGAYSSISLANIFRSISRATIQIFFGVFGLTAGGLIVGSALSNLFGLSRLIHPKYLVVSNAYSLTFKGVLIKACLYRRFPVFSAPAGLLNVLNTHVLSFSLPLLASSNALGFYALAMSVLGAPLMQISTPISQIFLRDAALELQNNGTASKVFLRTLKYLTGVSFLIFSTLYFTVEWIFGKIFGKDWIVAGLYAQILVPLFAVRFVVSPLSGMATLTDNRLSLAINAVLLLVSTTVALVGMALSWTAVEVLHVYAWSVGACYLFYLPVLLYLSGKKVKKSTHV